MSLRRTVGRVRRRRTRAISSPVTDGVASFIQYAQAGADLSRFPRNSLHVPGTMVPIHRPRVGVHVPPVAKGRVYIGLENGLGVYSASGCGQATCAPLWTDCGPTSGPASRRSM